MKAPKPKSFCFGKQMTSSGIMKPCIVLVLLIFLLHFCSYTTKEKEEVYEMWWVWKLGDEDTVKTIKPIEWGETADNSEVMGLIEFDTKHDTLKFRTSPDILDSKTSEKKSFTKPNIDKVKTDSSPTEHKLIVVLQKTPTNSALNNQTHCGPCTWSTRLEDVGKADAVIIDDDYVRSNEIPKRRNSQQLFIWMNSKSPYESIVEGFTSPRLVDGVFNMTMTHRRDSDIYHPLFTSFDFYRYFNQKPGADDLTKLIGSKSRFVYWKPEQCGNTKASRMAFDIAYRLRVSGLKIDFYGKCWKGWRPHQQYSEQVFQKYKFYLAVGNEWHCRDYLGSEIWMNAFYFGAVPIIWGPKRKDVESLLPPNSFLFLEDFASAFELTNYIEFLYNDDDAFFEYLEWRQKPFAELFSPHLMKYQTNHGFCQLCSMLGALDSKQIYEAPSLYKWWVEGDSPYCTDPQSPLANWFESFVWRREKLVLKTQLYFPFIIDKAAYLCVLMQILLIIFFYLLVSKTYLYQHILTLISQSTLFKKIREYCLICDIKHVWNRKNSKNFCETKRS